MSASDDLADLLACFHDSPAPSYKVTSYFPAYVELFRHLRNTTCTLVEVGVLNGGSLFMWRSWLGKDARIIGIDMNPQAEKWRADGFDIYIGDQGDPDFWRSTFPKIGQFDAFIDDAGHQSFQQIITVSEALAFAANECVIVVEDTCTSLMNEFAYHRQHSFLQFAKESTDVLTAKMAHFFPGQFPRQANTTVLDLFKHVHSIQFYSGIVGLKLNHFALDRPELIWNRRPDTPQIDFRYQGRTSGMISWPDPFDERIVTVEGKPNS